MHVVCKLLVLHAIPKVMEIGTKKGPFGYRYERERIRVGNQVGFTVAQGIVPTL